MAAVLNRLIGLGAGLAITGAVINSTLYNGTFVRVKLRGAGVELNARSYLMDCVVVHACMHSYLIHGSLKSTDYIGCMYMINCLLVVTLSHFLLV